MVVTKLRRLILIFGSLFLATHVCNYLFNIPWQPNPRRLYPSFEPTGSDLLLVRNDDLGIDDRLVSVARIKEEASPGNLSVCVLGYKCQAFSNITVKLRLNKTTLEVIRAEHQDVGLGGTWRPADCQSQWRIALIIPIRDREQHLRTFVRNIIPFLKNQKAEFTIFAVEQQGEEYFNKAQTMDAGFVETQKLGQFDCFIFHDVDMVPINPCNLYRCERQAVRHLGISRDLDRPHKVYGACIGGASTFTKAQFEKINGFTTVMFGWGGEDDDAYFRIRKENMKLFRYRPVVGNYFPLPHKRHSEQNFPRIHRNHQVLTHWQYRKYDGLNTLTYKVIKVTKEAMFTRIQIQIPGPTSRNQIKPFLIEKQKLFREMLCRDTNMTLCASVNNTEVSNANQSRLI